MDYKYYFFHLEMSLKNRQNREMYAFINVSDIPTQKLVEIFNINLQKDPYILDCYIFTKTMLRKNKKYINKNIGYIDLELFQYALCQTVSNDHNEIRKFYKEKLME